MASETDAGVTAGTGWGTTFDAGGLLSPDGGLRCSAIAVRARTLLTQPISSGFVAWDVAARDGGVSLQLLDVTNRLTFYEARVPLTGGSNQTRNLTGTLPNFGRARRALDPVTGSEAFAWGTGSFGSAGGTGFRVVSPQWTGPMSVLGELTSKPDGVSILFNPVQREWVTFSSYQPGLVPPESLTMTRRSLDGGPLSATVVATGSVWSPFPLTSFVWTGSDFFGSAERWFYRYPADGGTAGLVAELPWASGPTLAASTNDIGVLFRATDGGALYFTRVAPTGAWQQPVATLVSPVSVRPTPAMVWDGRRFRVTFTDIATDQPWTAALTPTGVLESFEALGCDPNSVWNEPRLAVLDAGLVAGTFVNAQNTGVLLLP